MSKTWCVRLWRWGLHSARPCRWLPRGGGTFEVRWGLLWFTLQWRTGKGICVVRRTQMSALKVGVALAETHWVYPNMKKRQSAVSTAGVKHLAPLESGVFSQLMPLIEHCAVRQYDDGDPREPGWFTVKTQGAAWIVQVKDPDACVSFSAVGETLDKALETACLLLSCDEAPWEPDGFLSAAKARKKK